MLIMVLEWILLPLALPPSWLVRAVVVLVVARSPPRTKTQKRHDEYVNMNRMKWTTTERTQVTSTLRPHSLETLSIIL